MKLLIFTYAPAGLGHLRVTDALADFRPKTYPYTLLGSIDKFVTWAHRFSSINPFGKYLFLKSQYGLWEDVFTSVYRWFLVHTANGVYRQMRDIIERSFEVDEVWVVATHFGMAHQVGAMKERLVMETGKPIKLIVQVTDDTHQHIWCVRGADLTFVPSRYVQKKFETYTKKEGIDFVSEVIPYPLSSVLTKRLPKSFGVRQKVFAEKTGHINVVIPISGAAVGMTYLLSLVEELNRISDRFRFFVLVKESPWTGLFIAKMKTIKNAVVLVGKNDIQMIELYELLYQKNLIHLEITKPSEQAFKSIVYPTMVGGSVLLLTTPVGRQEKENIKFLERHGLMPTKDHPYTARAIRLSENPAIAAKFIRWGAYSGLFRKMTDKNFKFLKSTLKSGEIGPDGARLFWKKLKRYMD